MTRLYFIGGIIAAFAVLIWLYHGEIRQNEQLKISVKSASETIMIMEKDRKDKEAVNQQLRKVQEELAHENARLENDLARLPRTTIQRNCDLAPTPAGYAARMLKYANTQGPVHNSGTGMAGTNADGVRLSEPGDLRAGEK